MLKVKVGLIRPFSCARLYITKVF
ncbi:hypothetical protein FPSE_03131 [Fusarium pseudograminearum CS3096]|uniref:Uncharacterized protein n=1 Tax=Fusarium pseudograminearum (strain CS3096) TaxID=1028729 RepID=K3W1Y7_FUSPC|nr:hypothetical protein FPSE_03131 [Fusarium pseudograminearum CS3096]EKJ76720.1 hypothetical protein FPSE_03131 [Fusarium pseudograminearum CS3096]